MNHNNVDAIFCMDINELMLESGRTIKVPDQVARTVSSKYLDTRFVKSWAVMNQLVPAHGEIGIFHAA